MALKYYILVLIAVVFTLKMGPSFILQRDTSSMNTRVYLLQGNSDFETPIAVRVLLTRFLLTYFQVSTILSFKGWLLLVQTLLLEKPTPNFLLLMLAQASLASWHLVGLQQPPAERPLALEALLPLQLLLWSTSTSRFLLQQSCLYTFTDREL